MTHANGYMKSVLHKTSQLPSHFNVSCLVCSEQARIPNCIVGTSAIAPCYLFPPFSQCHSPSRSHAGELPTAQPRSPLLTTHDRRPLLLYAMLSQMATAYVHAHTRAPTCAHERARPTWICWKVRGWASARQLRLQMALPAST